MNYIKSLLISLLVVASFSGYSSATPSYKQMCKGNICDVYFANSIDDADSYIDLLYQIEAAQTGDVYNIHLAGYGGAVTLTVRLYNAIKMSHAEVNMYVEGPVYSSHAMLAMLGKHIFISPASFFMFHYPAIMDQKTFEYVFPQDICKNITKKDRGQDAKQKCYDMQNYEMSLLDMVFESTIYPYLTKDEINRIKQGYDVYVPAAVMIDRLIKIQKGV